MKKLFFFLCGILLTLFFSVSSVKATTYTWTGNYSTAWENTANWSPGGNPGSAVGDIVEIGVGGFLDFQPTLSVAPAYPLSSITLGTGKNATLTISVAYTTGLLTIGAGSTVTESGTIAPTFTGGITNSGTYTASTGLHTFSTYDQSLNGIISIPNVTVTGVTLTNNNTLTVGTALSGTGGLTQAASATLNIGGTSDITTITATNSGNTVNYTGSTQTVKPTSYVNLTLSGSGAKTTTGATVNGILSMEGTATASVALTYGTNATLQYKGSAAQIIGPEFPATFGGSGGVIIDNSHGVTLNGTNTITYGLTITNGPLILSSSESTLGQLTVSGINATTLNGSNCIQIQSTQYGTGSFIDNGFPETSTGTAEVQLYLTALALQQDDAWHGVSSPVTDAISNVFFGQYLEQYSESKNIFSYITSTSVRLTPMQGYFAWVTSTTADEFSGTLNTGNMSIGVTRTYISGLSNGPYNGWNLVGNPYPSSIDLSKIWSSNSHIDNAFWIWDPIHGNYTVNPTQVGNYGTHDQYLPPMQAFFVHCNDTRPTQPNPGSGTVTFSNAERVHSSEPFLKSNDIIPNLLRIRAQTNINSYADELTVYFDPARTNYYEPGYDALKHNGNADAPQIYTLINDTAVTVNSMVFDRKNITVPMGFYISVPGSYTLNASNLENFDNAISVHLEDLKLNVTQNLKLNPVYCFTYDTTDAPNRFILHFDNPTFGVNDVKDIKPVQIYSYENSIYIDAVNGKNLTGSVNVYDLLGQELYQQSLPNQQMTKMNLNLTEGYYVVKVVSDQGVYIAKVYLK